MATNKQELSRDLKELLLLLKKANVEFMDVGGYAVSYHGYPRITKDSVIWLQLSEENSDRVVIARKEFGFNLPTITPEKFRDPLRVCRMGLPPNQVDFLVALEACDFDDCITRSCSLANKLAAGRPRDIADAHELKNI